MQKQYFMQLDERTYMLFSSLLSTGIQNPRIPEIKCNVNPGENKKNPTDHFCMICFMKQPAVAIFRALREEELLALPFIRQDIRQGRATKLVFKLSDLLLYLAVKPL